MECPPPRIRAGTTPRPCRAQTGPRTNGAGSKPVGNDHRVAEIVGQHQCADTQACRHRGHGRQGAKRSELLAIGTSREVVTHEKDINPCILDTANMVEPRRPAEDGLIDHTKPKNASHTPPLVNTSGTAGPARI